MARKSVEVIMTFSFKVKQASYHFHCSSRENSLGVSCFVYWESDCLVVVVETFTYANDGRCIL